MNALDAKIGAKIYAWIRDGKRPLRGEDAAALLLERQIDAISRLKSHGITIKINSIIIPGINDTHIPEIARRVAALGADIMNCVPMVPVQGSGFAELPEPDNRTAARVRSTSGQYLPQMSHCARCRADAVGFLGETMLPAQLDALRRFANGNPNPADAATRPCVAVASLEGALVNQHIGEATRLLLYRPHPDKPDTFELKEIRPTLEPGSGEGRWVAMAELLRDCRALLVMAAGPSLELYSWCFAGPPHPVSPRWKWRTWDLPSGVVIFMSVSVSGTVTRSRVCSCMAPVSWTP